VRSFCAFKVAINRQGAISAGVFSEVLKLSMYGMRYTEMSQPVMAALTTPPKSFGCVSQLRSSKRGRITPIRSSAPLV
jgi:hypothetical protein